MDEYRVCKERYKEHLSSIRDSDYTDDTKYAFMSRHGGPCRSMDVYSLHILAYPCEETNTFGTRVARNPFVSEASE